jgi:hypothetical protein
MFWIVGSKYTTTLSPYCISFFSTGGKNLGAFGVFGFLLTDCYF